MTEEDAFDTERRGAAAGLNPMFGDWERTFNFAPIPYRDGGSRLRAFRQQMHDAVSEQYFFSGEVRLDIVLHLDVQTVLETSETADVDNFAKGILDGLKGPKGVLFDDTQVQALTIYWVDSHGQSDTRFYVAIKASPDEFLMKPQEFYELSDGLWYPHGRSTWNRGNPEEQPEAHKWAVLLTLDEIVGAEKRTRHALRQAGHDRLSAYQVSRYLGSLARGFHKSRLDDGFLAHGRRQWRAEFEHWLKTHKEEFAPFADIVAGVRTSRDAMAAALRGELSGKTTK